MVLTHGSYGGQLVVIGNQSFGPIIYIFNWKLKMIPDLKYIQKEMCHKKKEKENLFFLMNWFTLKSGCLICKLFWNLDSFFWIYYSTYSLDIGAYWSTVPPLPKYKRGQGPIVGRWRGPYHTVTNCYITILRSITIAPPEFIPINLIINFIPIFFYLV